jgi:hypothetical protein
MEGSGCALIWDKVSGVFLVGLRNFSGKVIYYSWSPGRALNLNLGYSGIENMIATCFLFTDENSLTCF